MSRRQGWLWCLVLALLLAPLLPSPAAAAIEPVVQAAYVAPATPEGAPADTPERPSAANNDVVAALVPGRLLAERPASTTEVAVAPPAAAVPVPFAHRDGQTCHDNTVPRTRRAPSAGDRAPPSH